MTARTVNFLAAALMTSTLLPFSQSAVAQDAGNPCPAWVANCATQGCDGTPNTPPNNQHGANFERQTMRGDLSRTNFHGARLSGSDWSSGVDLSQSNFHGADLRNANLRGAKLWGACLHGTDLRNADLEGADLRCSCAHGADFSGANRSGVDLRGAITHGARM